MCQPHRAIPTAQLRHKDGGKIGSRISFQPRNGIQAVAIVNKLERRAQLPPSLLWNIRSVVAGEEENKKPF